MQDYPVTRRYRSVQPVLLCLLLLSMAASNMVAAAPEVNAAVAAPLSVRGLLHVIFALIAVLGLFAAGVLVLRRYGRLSEGSAGRLRIVDGVALGTRDRLLLVEVDNEHVLLGVSPGNIQALHVVGTAPEHRTRLEFQTQLRDLMQQSRTEQGHASDAS